MERDQVIQVGRLRGIEKFEGEIEIFILNTFINFKPVKTFENRSAVSEFRSFNNGASKGVLDLLETMYLRLRRIVVQRLTVIKFGMYYGGCNDTGCFGIKIRTDAAKLANVRIARFRECRDLVRECEMFVKNEATVTNRVSGVKRRVMYFSKLLFKSYEKKFSLGGVKS